MRFTPPVLALGLVLASWSSAVVGQPAPADITPRSAELMRQAEAARAAGRLEEAIGLYETAAAVDPANRAAFVMLGELAHQQGLDGKAIRYYRQALDIEPHDADAIAGEGVALASRGAVERAKQLLAELRTLCTTSCPGAERVSAAIAQAERRPQLQASAVTSQPTISEVPAKEN